MAITIKREGPGYYAISANGRTVSVVRNPDLAGPDKWIAGARWDRHLHTDPVATYRDAKRHARRMLDADEAPAPDKDG